MTTPRRAIAILALVLLSAPFLFSDEVGLTLDGWFGWTSSLGEYFLSGETEPLDLTGPINGGAARMEVSYDRGAFFGSMVLGGSGSYTLTGGSHDVLRLMDLVLGVKGGVLIGSVLRPHLFAGLAYVDYTLLVPHHPQNSAVLHLFGLRTGAGIDIRFLTLNLGRYDLSFELSPEYVLDILFSETPILVQEFRGRATVRFILQ